MPHDVPSAAGQPGGVTGSRSNAIAWLAGLVFCAPIIVDIALRGTRAAMTYLAHDAFYYLGVGRNVVEHGMFSFDRQFPTNGFHPLWQWAVALLEGVRSQLGWSEVANLTVVALISALTVASAIVILGLALKRQYGTLAPVYPLVIVGVVGSIASLCHYRFGTLFVFANGMETPFLLLGYACTITAAARFPKHGEAMSVRFGVGLGLALALTVLSRLEHALFVVFALVVLLLHVRQTKRGFKALLWAAAIPAAALLGYMLVNVALFGSPVPISGAMKSTFPYPKLGNLRAILSGWDPEVMGRSFHMLLPLPFAAADLLVRARRVLRERTISVWDAVLASWSAFVIAFCCYNFAFVSVWHQGPWYFASAMLHVSVLVYDHTHRWLERVSAGRFAALATAASIVPVAWFVAVFHSQDPNELLHAFVARERDGLLAHYADKAPRFYSVDDGLLTYLTPFATMSGVGLTLDREAFAHRRAGKSMLGLAHERGFDRFVSWYYGRSLVGLTASSTQEEIADRLKRVPWFYDEFNQHGQGFTFHVEYVSPSGELVVLRFEPRAGDGGGLSQSRF